MAKHYMSGVALGVMMLFSGQAQADIVIGVAGPMTGQYAPFGAQLKAGAEQAVADINAAGGINGEKLVLKIGDDACDPKQAVAVANKFAQDGVKFVAGHFCSGSSIPASSVYAEEGILQISPGSTNPSFTDARPGPGIYRVCGRDDKQGVVAGDYLAEKFAGKNVAILHDKSAYGKGLADETQKAFNAKGGKEVLYEAITVGERDYSALVSRLKAANVDAVYLGGYHTEAGLILRQMRDQGLQAQLFAGDALVTEEFWSVTGPAGEGTMMTFSPDARKFPAAAEIVKKFEDKGFNPEGYTLYTYAALQIFAKAAADAKSTELEALVEKLNSETFQTVIGAITFDGKGDPTDAPYVWYQWKNGAYAELEN